MTFPLIPLAGSPAAEAEEKQYPELQQQAYREQFEARRGMLFLPPPAPNVQEVPAGGIMEGEAPESAAYPQGYAPQLENIRVVYGLMATRLGMASWGSRSIPSSAAGQYLAHLYPSSDLTHPRRLVGGGGKLYDFLDSEGSLTSRQTGLNAANVFCGASAGLDRHYVTDRAGTLQVYDVAGRSVAAISSYVAAPSANLTLTPRTFRTLERWTAAVPAGWTESDHAGLRFVTSALVPPMPAGYDDSVGLQCTASAAYTDKITSGHLPLEIPSATIAFWVRGDGLSDDGIALSYKVGQNAANIPLAGFAAVPKQWTGAFLPIGLLGTVQADGSIGKIQYEEFHIHHLPTATRTRYLSRLLLPGFLQGAYQWVYTYYDSATGRESGPSAAAYGDFSSIGVNGASGAQTAGQAMQKSAAMRFGTNSGNSPSTNKIRIYRSGGVPSLTTDALGNTLYVRVGEIWDQRGTLNGACTAGAFTATLHAMTNAVAVNDFLVLEPGTVREEYVQIKSISGAVNLTFWDELLYSHADASAVYQAFIDNVPDVTLDPTERLDPFRSPPPTAVQWLATAPDGRLWLANYTYTPPGGSATSRPGEIAVSNRATPDRPNDQEVFPDGVDPLTTQDPLQGWKITLPGEIIVWLGFYRGLPLAFTRSGVYAIHAYSQAEFGPSSVQKVLQIGCLNGETVAEVEGLLYWVAPGPRVMRWDGSGRPQDLSSKPLKFTMQNSPSTYWAQWFARTHETQDGAYYRLWMTPSGATANTLRCEFNVARQVWEMSRHYDSGGSAISWTVAAAARSGPDLDQLYAATGAGGLYQLETGLADAGQPIQVKLRTRRFPLGPISKVERLFLRLHAIIGTPDHVRVQVTAGGSEYGDRTDYYDLSIGGETGDLEAHARTNFRRLQGRWVELYLTGSVNNAPAFRELAAYTSPHRDVRISP